VPAIGTCGGILVAVDQDYYKITDTELGVHTLTAKLASSVGPVDWCITAVYGLQGDNEKLEFLEELRLLKHSVTVVQGF
jgi:hypothetical protein